MSKFSQYSIYRGHSNIKYILVVIWKVNVNKYIKFNCMLYILYVESIALLKSIWENKCKSNN